jgi:hypothetical protein
MTKRIYVWEPIRTAPKDGKQILIFTRRGNPATYEGVLMVEYSHSENDEDYWLLAGDGTALAYGATHWMPLPEAPSFDVELSCH